MCSIQSVSRSGYCDSPDVQCVVTSTGETEMSRVTMDSSRLITMFHKREYADVFGPCTLSSVFRFDGVSPIGTNGRSWRVLDVYCHTALCLLCLLYVAMARTACTPLSQQNSSDAPSAGCCTCPSDDASQLSKEVPQLRTAALQSDCVSLTHWHSDGA